MALNQFVDGIKLSLRIVLSIAMMIVGAKHFTDPEPSARIVPALLPHPLSFVYGSGLIEGLAGAGLLFPPVSRIAAWMLVILYIGVFPANLYQAIHNIPVCGLPHDPPLIGLRFPMQALLIASAYWLTKDERIAEQSETSRI